MLGVAICSADILSAVSRTSSPLPPGASEALPAGSRRYGRLETCATKGALWLVIALALAAQTFFWLCYKDLFLMTNRYLLPLAGLWALALPLLGQRLESRWPARGLVYTLLVFLMIGFWAFMRDDGIRAWYREPLTGALRCCAWYMQPPTRPTQFGTPCGAVQWLVLFVLLAGGTALLIRAWQLSRRFDTPIEQRDIVRDLRAP
jgi:hypothetical protein